MRRLALPLLFFFHLQLHAQYDDLLRNPDITWVAEYTTDFELNPVYNTKLEEEHNLLNIIRLENKSLENGICKESDLTVLVGQFILNGLYKGAFSCFTDSLLQKPVTFEHLWTIIYRPDTFPDFNHPTDTIIQVDQLRAEEIELFRARQVLYYNARERVLGARLIALAPVIPITDADGNRLGFRAVVWIKVPVLEGRAMKKLSKEANYVVQTRMKENAPALNQTTQVKGYFDFPKWAAVEVSKPSHQCLTYDAFRPFNIEKLKASVFTTDTIVSYNDNYEQTIDQIVQNDATRQVEKIRFVQNWYFDERSHAFDCRVVAVAPLAAIRDSEGNFRYYKPLFYVKY